MTADSRPLQRNHDPVFWSEDNPRSLYNLLPEPLQSMAGNMRKGADSSLLFMDEGTLHRQLVNWKRPPTPVEHWVRYNFWLEYDNCQAENRDKMNPQNIYRRLMTPEVFFEKYCDNPKRVAWMLCPPLDYIQGLEEALMFGIRMLRSCLELSPIKNDGSGFEERTLSANMRVIKFLEERLNNTALRSPRKNNRLVPRKKIDAEIAADAAVEDRMQYLTEEELIKKEMDLTEREAKLAADMAGGTSDKSSV